jgi:hypothetical protein
MAHPRHTEVRARYQGACGYCPVSDSDAGGEHTIDHYRPVSARGDDSDDNLVYCCFRCNTYKGDFWPMAEDLQHGRRVLHPLLDMASAHLREDGRTGHLVALTATGLFHLRLLQLNRPPLVEYRQQRRLLHFLTETHRMLRLENKGLLQRIALLEQHLEAIGALPPEEELGDQERP